MIKPQEYLIKKERGFDSALASFIPSGTGYINPLQWLSTAPACNNIENEKPEKLIKTPVSMRSAEQKFVDAQSRSVNMLSNKYIQINSSKEEINERSNTLIKKIILSLQNEPIEDNFVHPVETLIENTLKEFGVEAENWIKSIYFRYCNDRPSLAAAILMCIGRLSPLITKSWAKELIIKGISHPDIEIRDASVVVLEKWGGEDSILILKQYVDNEKISWLSSYMRQVIEDLSE